MDDRPVPAAAATYAWAKPLPTTSWGESEPLEYHRLMRGTPRFRWWKPLVALVLGVLYYLTFSVVFTFGVLIPYFVITDMPLTQAAILELAIPDTQEPISMLLGLGSVVLMIPAGWLALASAGLGHAGRIWSVAARIRWGLIGRTIVPALVALVIMNGVGIAAEIGFALAAGGETAEMFVATPSIDWSRAAWSILFIVLLVPLQAAAEEFVFRGVLMQSLGAWLRNPYFGMVIPSVLFGLAHIYDIWGMLSVVAMGLTLAWLAWRTGGLEPAISLHVINNWVAFGFLTVGFGGETGQSASGGGLGSLIGTVAGLVSYAWWVDRSFRRRDGIRTRIDYVERSLPA